MSQHFRHPTDYSNKPFSKISHLKGCEGSISIPAKASAVMGHAEPMQTERRQLDRQATGRQHATSGRQHILVGKQVG